MQSDGWMVSRIDKDEVWLLASLTDKVKVFNISNHLYYDSSRGQRSFKKNVSKLTCLLVHLGHQSAVRVVDALCAARDNKNICNVPFMLVPPRVCLVKQGE